MPTAHTYWGHHLPGPFDALSHLTLKRMPEGSYDLQRINEDIWTLNDYGASQHLYSLMSKGVGFKPQQPSVQSLALITLLYCENQMQIRAIKHLTQCLAYKSQGTSASSSPSLLARCTQFSDTQLETQDNGRMVEWMEELNFQRHDFRKNTQQV